MGRDSYRNRTAQKVSDILKSVTKERTTVLSEVSLGKLNSTMDTIFLKEDSFQNSYVVEIPQSGVSVVPTVLFSTIQANSKILNNILYGEEHFSFLVEETNFDINGETISPVGIVNSFGIQIDKALQDQSNPTVSIVSKDKMRYETIGESLKTKIFESLKNTREDDVKILKTSQFDMSHYIMLYIEGKYIPSSNYTIVDNETIEMKNQIPRHVDITVYTSNSDFSAKSFNSFKTNTMGITTGIFLTSTYSTLNVKKLKKNTYRIEYLGSKIFSSNIKIGDNYLYLLGDSVYYLKSGEILDGDYLNCKEFAKLFQKRNNGLYVMFGTLDYRVGKTYLTEGVV